MTRFARAKGSKASNERVADEPTPWHVMKQQMEEAEAIKNTPNEKAKSVKELLKEPDVCYSLPSNIPTDWAKFEPEKSTIDCGSKSKTSKNRKESEKHSSDDANEKIKKKKNKKINSTDLIENTEEKSDKSYQKSFPDASEGSKKKKKRKLDPENLNKTDGFIKNDENNSTQDKTKKSKVDFDGKDNEKSGEDSKKANGFEVLSKRQKRNRKNKMKNSNEVETNGEEKEPVGNGGFNVNGNDWGNNIKIGEKGDENFKQNYSNDFNSHNNSDRFTNKKVPPKRKPPKVRVYDKEFKRKKPLPENWKVMVNGMEIEISTFDGFTVKKEDAERLQELRNQMKMKGISKKDMENALKLERRKAEKALNRLKKTVCFHCRKAGHSFSDCPEMNKEEMATGICFKCGSTEHTHFECKVAKKEEFRFAKCFICREQGHVAKQCPDNPKGLYPNGGSCKICGDVTHLKKDCPDLQKEKEENTITLTTLNEAGNAVEALDGSELKKFNESTQNVKRNKIIKF